MSIGDLLLSLAAMVILGVIVIAANYADRESDSRMSRAVFAVLGLINLLLVAFYGVAQVAMAYSPATDTFTPPTHAEAWGGLLASVVVAGLATALLLYPIRERVAVLFPGFRGKAKRSLPDDESMAGYGVPGDESGQGGTPLFPQMLNYYTTDSVFVPRSSQAMPDVSPQVRDEVRGFNPRSMVHMVALVFVVYLIGIQMINFILGGGLEGIAQSYEENGLTALDLLVNSLPLVVIPFIGIGFGMRRGWRASLHRLGLELPSGEGLLVAFGLTILLFVFVATVAGIWIGLVSEETYEEQNEASEALSASVDSIGLAFLLAATAAIGEEIAFRGALQPVIGFWPTAVAFALTHVQYTLTPAWLIIFGVAIGFGWIRQRYNTTVAMATHFTYNFIPLALSVSVSDEAILSLLRMVVGL